jgi:hypothetical protein
MPTISRKAKHALADRVIRTACPARHQGPCDVVLSDANVVATLESHGVKARIVHTGVEGFEVATIDGVDASAWVAVPSGVHGLAEWLGY